MSALKSDAETPLAEPQSVGADLITDRPILRTSEAWARVMQAVKNNRPFSLVRFGDGEGLLLGTKDGYAPGRETIMRTWFGHQAPDPDTLVEPAIAAFRSADILAIALGAKPGSAFYDGVRSVLDNRLIGPDAVIASASIHVRIRTRGKLGRLLTDLDYVGLITCRDVASYVKAEYNVGRVEQFLVPEEAGHAFSIGPVRHYPDRFHELDRLIDPPRPGAIYLVGAGILGKIYCHWIKSRGGIAIDIGSVFDSWAGHHTRKYMGKIGKLGAKDFVDNHPRILANLDNISWPGSYIKVATALRESGHHRLAITVLLWGTMLFPEHGRLREQLAFMLARRGISARAVEEAKRAISAGKGLGYAEQVIAELGDAPPNRETPHAIERFWPKSSPARRTFNFFRRRFD